MESNEGESELDEISFEDEIAFETGLDFSEAIHKEEGSYVYEL
jgi:hypothetical protein